MARWMKRFRDGYADAFPTPYLLDEIKSRLAFVNPTPRRSRGLLSALVALQAFCGLFLVFTGAVLIGGANTESFTLLVQTVFGIVRYDVRDLRLGAVILIVGVILLAIDAVFVARFVSRRRGDPR